MERKEKSEEIDEEREKIRRKKMEEMISRQNDPKAKVKEFARAIIESEEYGDFMKHNEELLRNQIAQNLLREFQEKQREFQCNGFNPDTLEELRDLQSRINRNDTIQDFMNSQQELVDLLREANDLISIRIGMQFAFSQGGGCCG